MDETVAAEDEGERIEVPLEVAELWGIELRYVLTVLLIEAGQPLTVAELVARVRQEGFVLAGRPSKVISDALRWEMGRGRVVRCARATYRVGRMPRQTRSRIRRRVAARRLSLQHETGRDLGGVAPEFPFARIVATTRDSG